MGLLIASLLLPVLLVNPFREMLSEDDAWAYARTVQHLLATGRYQLDPWAAANMPAQIYVAAGLSKVFGYSLTLLRCTTLALLSVGVASFYGLLRELGHSRSAASVATLAIPASPLVLMLAFTFMSDVQFLGWLLLSLWLYVRGLRQRDAWSMLFGSFAGCAAIETRQFGIAIIGGLLLTWLLSQRENRPATRLMLASLIVPLCAAGVQIYLGLSIPNFTQAYRILEFHAFLGNPSSVMLKEFVWRCSIISQYVGMAVLPLLPMLPLIFCRQSAAGSRPPGNRKLPIFLTVAASVVIVVSLSMSSSLTARPEVKHHGLWEPLELYWMLPTQFARVRLAMRLLDLSGIIGAAALLWIGLSLLRQRRVQPFSSQTIFLTGTGATLLALHIAYVQLNDTYIVALIPFAVLLYTRGLRDGTHTRFLFKSSAVLSITLIVLTALWMRGQYTAQEAAWNSADQLIDAGIQPANIQAPLHWAEYHGGFDAWVDVGAPGFDPSAKDKPLGYDIIHDPFYGWLRERGKRAEYQVTESNPKTLPLDWQIVGSHGYRNARFAKRFVWTLKRSHPMTVPEN